TGASIYAWSSDDHAFSSSAASPFVQPTITTRYFVVATDVNGCVGKDTTQVKVIKKVDLKWEHTLKANCVDRPTLFVKNLTPLADSLTFQFDFGDGTISEQAEGEHSYQNDGTYSLKFKVQENVCSYEETVQLP